MIRTAIALLALLSLVACAPSPGPVKRKMIGLIQKFDLLDLNGDGQLSESELKDVAQVSGISAPEIVEFYDTSGNGTISLVEAQAGVSRVDEARELTKKANSGQ